MKLRHIAVWVSAIALLGTGATLLRAQAPQTPREAPVRTDRDKLRAEVIRLRAEVEMLRFDYELARDGLLEELKISRGLKMAGAMFGAVSAVQVAINEAGNNPPGEAPRKGAEAERKKAAEEAKQAEEEKKEAAQEAAAVAEAKKELARLYGLLASRRLDLEDAERNYNRETSR